MNSRKITSKMISRMSKQSLRSARMRNVFVIIAIALASSLLTVILMFAAGQNRQTKNALSHRQQVIYHNLTADQAAQLKNDNRIAFQIQVKTGILTEADGYSITPRYVSQLSDQIQMGELQAGKLPTAKEEAAVPAALLKKMRLDPAPGTTVSFTFYDGSTESFTVTGITGGDETEKQFFVYFSEDYAAEGSQLKDMPFEVYAKLHGAGDMSADACREAMYAVGIDAGIRRENISPSKAFLDSLSLNTNYVLIYGLTGMVILLACVLVIYGVFYLSIIGRIHQFGQLRTIGMTRKQIRKFVSREGAFLFLCSCPAGIAVGCAAGYFLIPDGFYVPDTLRIIAAVSVLTGSVTMVSVQKPARMAAAVSPIEALRCVSTDTAEARAGKKRCRKLTPLGLGVMNFSRNHKKTAVTMLSLSLGGILFMTASVYLSSFDRESWPRQGYFKNAEFLITYSMSAIELRENGMSDLQANAPMDEEIIRSIASLDGVKKVTPVKKFGVLYDYPKNDMYNGIDAVIPLTEEETAGIGEYLEEGSADLGKLMSGSYVLTVDNDTAEEYLGWRFVPGDTVTLHYFDGEKSARKEVEILGTLSSQYVLDHNDISNGWFLMPEQAILKWLSFDSLNADLLVSTEPEKEAAVGDRLAEIVSEKPELTMETLADLRTSYGRSANQIFLTVSGLAVFIMAFSILSMINTLITNIVTRRFEIAVLSSIGMTGRQIRKMLLAESLLFSLSAVGIAMTAGTLCGFALTTAMYNGGAFYMAFRFPTVFAAVYTGVLLSVPLCITLVFMHGFPKGNRLPAGVS